MMKVNTKEIFNTRFGLIFGLNDIKENSLHIGDEISVNGQIYTIKRFIFPTRPTKEGKIPNKVSIVV